MNRTLLVYVPGMRSVSRAMPLLTRLLNEPQLRGADLFIWKHGCGYLSTKYAEAVSRDLAAAIAGKAESASKDSSPYSNVILLGHSFGGVLVRNAYLIGLGSGLRRMTTQDWALKVSRIVLFASINRGIFAPEDQPNQPYRIRRWLGRHIIEMLSQLPFLHLLAEDLLAGSDFVTNLRLWWIRKLRRLPKAPTVVQLVGTADAIVRASDSLDIEQDLTGNQIEVSEADHSSVVVVEGKNRELLEDRYALIRKALFDPFRQSPSPIPKEQQKSQVFFIVHGIASNNNTWVRDAQQRISSAVPEAEVVPATYWHFSALQFLLPLSRRRKIRWFMDTYSYYLAKYPEAEFQFLGHSNGTYLFGQALMRLSGMRFNRAVLAGSVLPRTFDWRALTDRQQVAKLFNHRALWDVPVAILCNALRGLRMTDVGTGGYEGFAALTDISECHYHRGGHGAALQESSLPVLTSQVLGTTALHGCASLQQAPSGWFNRLSTAAISLPYLLIATILLLAYRIGPSVAFKIHLSGAHAPLIGQAMVGSGLLAAVLLILQFVV